MSIYININIDFNVFVLLMGNNYLNYIYVIKLSLIEFLWSNALILRISGSNWKYNSIE